MIPYDQLSFDVAYHARCKRNGKHAYVTIYGAGRMIEKVKGTDPNCFSQDVSDYEFIRAAIIPADVLDELSTARMERVEPRMGGLE